MRIHRPITTAALIGAALIFPGCFDSSTSPTGPGSGNPEEDAIQSELAQQEGLTDPDVFVYDTQTNGSQTPIATDTWRRELVSLNKTIQITLNYPQGEPATANVQVSADASGILHLFVRTGELQEFTKNWADHGVRQVFFTRGDGMNTRSRGWRLTSVSGVLLASPGTTRQIRSVHIKDGDVDRTITNVTDLVPVADLLRLPPGTTADISVDTGDATDQVYLHLRWREARLQLISNGDGTFSGRFDTGDRDDGHHLAVDVLSHDTLLDDTAPYDNVAWGIPFRVGPPLPGGD
jgi:hypothetical protein